MEAMPPLDEATYMARFNAPAVVASGPSLTMVPFSFMTGLFETCSVLITRFRVYSSVNIVLSVLRGQAFDREYKEDLTAA